MELLRLVSLPKEPDYPEANEDTFVMAKTGKAAALSDGASESFDSRTWARLICESFIAWAQQASATPGSDRDVMAVLASARERFRAEIAQRELSWSQMAAMARGNFASLVAIRDLGADLECLAIGDSIAVWARPNGQLRSHVLTQPEEFARNPVLLSSDPRGDSVVFERERARWSWLRIAKSDLRDGRILLLTDAIGHYVLNGNLAGQWGQVLALIDQSDDDLRFWLTKERFSRSIRKDDTTLALLKTDHATQH